MIFLRQQFLLSVPKMVDAAGGVADTGVVFFDFTGNLIQFPTQILHFIFGGSPKANHAPERSRQAIKRRKLDNKI
ncbi:hypothetical protein BRX37_16515 [Sphingomonas sp. S-NIH.Pt3_0716]|nr:hypothetical protein BRX37_16515 [Sphingomonas sp. S-NIH.Pt3_0716]